MPKSTKKKSGKRKTTNGKITLKNPNQQLIGYCVVCKAKGKMNDCQFFLNPNGSVRVAGKCQVCNTNMNTFMKGDQFNKII